MEARFGTYRRRVDFQSRCRTLADPFLFQTCPCSEVGFYVRSAFLRLSSAQSHFPLVAGLSSHKVLQRRNGINPLWESKGSGIIQSGLVGDDGWNVGRKRHSARPINPRLL